MPKFRMPFFSGQSLLLSTIVLNDIAMALIFKLLPKVVIGYLKLRKDLQLITIKK